MTNQDFRLLFEKSTVIQLVIDTNFNIISVSDAFLNTSKTGRDVTIGKNVFDIFPDNPEESGNVGSDILKKSYNWVIKNKITDTLPIIKYDIPNLEAGGFITKYWKTIQSPILDDNDDVKYILQIAEDITEQETLTIQLENEKDALNKIEDSEKRYNMMLMKSPFGYAVFKGKNMVITLANDSIKQFWGKGNDVEGKSLIEVLPELKGQGFTELLDKVYTTGIPYIANEALAKVKRNGKMEDMYFNFVYQPYRETDDTISGVTIIAIEVTNEVIAKQKIKDSQQQFQNIFMQAPFALNIYEGKELVISLTNKLFCEIIGKTESEILGKKLFDAFPETATQGLDKILSDVFSTGIPFKGNEFPVHFLKHGNEFKGYFDFIYQPIFDYNKNVSGVINVAIDVTEKVLARKKIEESEHRYHELIYSSPSMIAIFKGEEMIIEIANDSIMESWGKGKDIIGKSLLSIMPEIIEQGFDKILSDVYKTGIAYHAYEAPVSLFRNGKMEVLHYTFVYQAQRNINGEIEGVAVIANEVTPKAKYHLQIKESEERFRLLAMQAPVAICVVRGEKYVVEIANEKILEIWGRTDDQVLNKPIFEVLTELEDQGFEALVDNVYTTGERFVTSELPITLMRKGQLENTYVTFVYEPLREMDGTISGIMVLAHEITDLVVARKKMEVQNALFENMLMTSPGFVSTLCGSEHVHELVNEQYQSLFGKRHLKGKPIMVALPELEGQGFDKLLDKVYTTGETYVGIDIPATMARDEGLAPELRYFNFSYQPMYNEFKEIYSILVFGYEVTEQVVAKNKNLETQEIRAKELEEKVHQRTLELIEANKALEEKNKEMAFQSEEKEKRSAELVISNRELVFESGEKEKRSAELIITNIELAFQSREKEKRSAELTIANKELESFNYISSHDLQEPLRKIQTFAALIVEKEYQNLSENGKYIFKRMQLAASRMRQLIEDLLSFSRLNTAERKFEPTSLNHLINEVLIDFKEIIDNKQAVVEVTSLVELKVIPFQFRQLIQNLLSNALKFAKADIPLHVKISSVVDKGRDLFNNKLLPDTSYCHIVFEDNGIGFDQTFSDRIFEVFQKLHSRDEYAGTGIGLAIVKKIIENHNGFVSATSELGKGSRFDIYIPVT